MSLPLAAYLLAAYLIVTLHRRGEHVRYILIILVLGMLNACAAQRYVNTPTSRYHGALDVRWVKNDFFQFIPNQDDPFIFTRANGKTIRPGIMYTDGGSIPRFAWGIPGYSPWGYAPAYIVHDWLFEAKHCGYPPDDQYSFDETVEVMAEGLKAVMESNPEYRNYFVFDTVVAAVGSPIANRIWDKGECKAPNIRVQGLDQQPLGELIMTIRFE